MHLSIMKQQILKPIAWFYCLNYFYFLIKDCLTSIENWKYKINKGQPQDIQTVRNTASRAHSASQLYLFPSMFANKRQTKHVEQAAVIRTVQGFRRVGKQAKQSHHPSEISVPCKVTSCGTCLIRFMQTKFRVS